MNRHLLNTHPFWRKLLQRAVNIIVLTPLLFGCILSGLIVSGLVLVGIAAAGMSSEQDTSQYRVLYGAGQNALLSIPITGMIVGSDDEIGGDLLSTSGGTAGYTIKDKLYAAANDDTIYGVILEINSPGGAIYGARAIADGVHYYQMKTKRPVFAHIQGMGDSGAYWAAASTNKIYADYGSDVGSIGVIMGPFQYYDTVLAQDDGILGGGVVTQNGIQSLNITAGKSKDVGNPYRQLTPEEIAQLQKTVNREYEGFVGFVSTQRNITSETIKTTIGAYGYDPATAKELKLVDEIGSRQAAYNALARAAGVSNDFYVTEEQTAPSFIQSLLSAKKETTTTPHASSVCQGKISLAYHGDLKAVCKL